MNTSQSCQSPPAARMMNRRSIAFLLVLVFCSQRADAQRAKEVPVGAKFPSPDGRFTVECVMALLPTATDQYPTTKSLGLAIKNRQTGGAALVYVPPPVFSIKWTGDSKTIVAIGHLAGGSQAMIYCCESAEWKPYEVDPPNVDDLQTWAVVRQKIGFHTLEITYKLDHLSRRDEHGRRVYEYDLGTYEVDVTTGKIIKTLKQREISGDTYGRLRSIS